MDAYEPRVRRRGFFLHSDTTGEPDTGEHENPEGVVIRVRIARPARARQVSAARGASRSSSSEGRAGGGVSVRDDLPQIRSGSVTGSRQRAHSPR
jgi:hypothetical protein